MGAGYNIKIDVWRWTYEDDDEVGGASPTGTYIYRNVRARKQQTPSEQLFLQQGLETVKTFTCNYQPGTLDIRERDEITVVCPSNHPDCGKRFRVVNNRPSDFNPSDRRNYGMLELTRTVEAHANQ